MIRSKRTLNKVQIRILKKISECLTISHCLNFLHIQEEVWQICSIRQRINEMQHDYVLMISVLFATVT